jgi:LPXTG-site transpeptidase (sortase) family protein
MEIKKLGKYFVFLLLLTLIIFNWNEVSWVFNYRVVSEFFSGFLKSSREKIQVTDDYNDFNETEGYEYSEKENSIEIPKIEVTAPLVFVDSVEIGEIKKGLDLGVVHFADSVLPGQPGQTIILGHSAPPNWPQIKYYWVFVRINELIEGDEVYVFFNNRKYEYTVTRKFILEKGEETPEDPLTNNTNVLLLISCWPPETGTRRITVEAQLK